MDLDQSYKEYSNIVRDLLKDYFLLTLRSAISDEDMINTADAWSNKFIKMRIPASKLELVYDKTMLKFDYLTAPAMLRTWLEMQTQGVNTRIKICELCKGKGTALNYNFETEKDEEITCVCKIGQI